jgi:hypothetical protein
MRLVPCMTSWCGESGKRLLSSPRLPSLPLDVSPENPYTGSVGIGPALEFALFVLALSGSVQIRRGGTSASRRKNSEVVMKGGSKWRSRASRGR